MQIRGMVKEQRDLARKVRKRVRRKLALQIRKPAGDLPEKRAEVRLVLRSVREAVKSQDPKHCAVLTTMCDAVHRALDGGTCPQVLLPIARAAAATVSRLAEACHKQLVAQQEATSLRDKLDEERKESARLRSFADGACHVAEAVIETACPSQGKEYSSRGRPNNKTVRRGGNHFLNSISGQSRHGPSTTRSQTSRDLLVNDRTEPTIVDVENDSNENRVSSLADRMEVDPAASAIYTYLASVNDDQFPTLAIDAFRVLELRRRGQDSSRRTRQ